MHTYISTNKVKITNKFFNLVGILATVLIFVNGAFEVQAAPIAQYTGGIVVYADGTTGTPKYKTFDDTNGFGSEQSATAVGSSAIEWVRVAASPTRDEWIIATRDAADDIIVQVCTGVDGGLSCGATTTITATAGAHGFRNFDVAYEKTSGDALLVYGTATADELRKIEWNGTSWTSDAAITTTRTTGTVEWVELTSRNASDQIGIAYSDTNDDVSAYRWSGTAAGNEATGTITATAATTDLRKMDVSFEGASGDMLVAAPLAAAGTTAIGHLTGSTWAIFANTDPDNVTGFIDLQEPNPSDDDIAMIAHGVTAAGANTMEGYEGNGVTPTSVTTGLTDGTIAVDTSATNWAASIQLGAVAYLSSTYYAVAAFSDITGADDINWWTMSSAGVWTAQTDNTRTRGTTGYVDIFDYPNTDKVLLLSSDANSDLWADTWSGTSTGATVWIDLTSAGTLENSLVSTTTDVVDFSFRLAPPPAYLSGVLYTDAGVTTAASGKVIKMAVGTSTLSVHSATTTSGGVWTFENQTFSTATSGTPFALWLDGDASDANTLVTGFASTSNLTGIPIYYDYVMSYASGTTDTVDLNNFAFYDSSDDADLLYTVVGSTATSSTNLFIKRGIFVPTNDLVVAGNYQNNGTLTASTSEITFTGSSKTLVGNMTGTSAFNDLTIKGSYTISSTTASTTNLTIKTGGSLTAPSGTLTISGDYTNNGTFVDNTGTLNIGAAMGNFTSGFNADAGTSSTDGTAVVVTTLVNGNYLYVGTYGSSTPCTQVAGFAEGCEIQVYDISDPESPVYVAGRDLSGSATGAYTGATYSLAIKGNYLYVGQLSLDAVDCHQTAGNAVGCELTVYDISSPINPTFVTSIDHDGSLLGSADSIYFNTLAIKGNYLYAGKYAAAGACSSVAGSAGPCELMVFDISNPDTLTFVAGRDADGSGTGITQSLIFSIIIKDSHIYVSMSADGSACGQTAGTASGCELQVYDVSSSTNPVYVAGRDADGSTGGSTVNTFYDLTISSNYLYVTSGGDIYTCGQTAGSANSCELHVYNISSSTNPVYVAGRDVDGSSVGNGANDQSGAFSASVSGNYLYLGVQASSTPCSQVIGSASGCELQTYDISSSSNPLYVAGRDSSGSSDGTGAKDVYSLSVANNYLYVGKDASSNACTQTAGGAEGCELMFFRTASALTGSMVASDLYNVNISGTGAIFNDSALINNLTIQSGATTTAPSIISLSGNYTNNGVFDANDGEVIFYGSSKTIDGTLTGASAFKELTVSGSYSVATTAASTTNLTINAGGSLTAPSNMLTVAGNFENNGTYTHNSGTLDMNPATEVLQYLGGTDLSGSATGTSWHGMNTIAISGNYLYGAKTSDAAACAQTIGGAEGCELQVYDISSTTNPVYVAGRDVSGSSSGTGNIAVRHLRISGSYLYVAKAADSTACSQVAGSAIGCELMVFDISSSTNPTYAAGRDASGSSSGTAGTIDINQIIISGSYLYVGKTGDITACSQIAGSAIGCELMVFDISSTTNPTYSAGRDSDGSSTGVTNFNIYSFATSPDYLYVGKEGQGSCAQTAGLAYDCELHVYDISTPTTPTLVRGMDISGSPTGQAWAYFSTLLINGSYLYTGKGGNGGPCSSVAGGAEGCELQVYDVSSSTDPVYITGVDFAPETNQVASNGVVSLATAGNYLYVGGNGDGTSICAQVEGVMNGCALVVYDISSTTNPLHVVGRTGTGLVSGSDNSVNSMVIVGEYLYTANGGESVACSQVAGLAAGCELKVLRSVVTGAISGTLTGSSALKNVLNTGTTKFLNTATTSNLTISGTTTLPTVLTVNGNYSNNGTAHYAPAALVYFDSNSAQSIAGTLNSSSSLPSLSFLGSGVKTLSSIASTSNLTIASASEVDSDNYLDIRGSINSAGAIAVTDTIKVGGSFANTGVASVSVVDIDAAVGDYLAGLDISGSATGTSDTSTVAEMAVSGNYLYVGTYGNDTACAQTIGSAAGCELQVYDISSTTNPVYIAGRDDDGSATGTYTSNFYSVVVSGSYLFIGKDGNDYACSQSVGAAFGCELMVFDISNPANPTYVAGRDVSGSAAGVGDNHIVSLSVSGNYLYVGMPNNSTACSQVAGSAIGCEIMVFDIGTPTSPTYVAGRDINGSATGSDYHSVRAIYALGNYLYVGNAGNDNQACSQTAGFAYGCELQVYNISTPTNPVYVAGRDANAAASGSTAADLSSLSSSGNYLYAGFGINYNGQSCAQTAGSAIGCELQVYDISSSTNPTYVAGRDINGSTDGSEYQSLRSLSINGNYLYVGKNDSEVACAQTAGSAIGCELQIYDISSTTNPTYVAGRDIKGARDTFSGNGVEINSIVAAGDYVYLGKTADTTACSQTAGSALGCELMVFPVSPFFSGSFYYDPLGDFGVNVGGSGAIFEADMQIGGDLTVESGARLVAPANMTLNSNYTNNGSFDANNGAMLLVGATKTLGGTLTGSSTLGDVNITGSYTFSSTASTKDLTINSGDSLTLGGDLNISGDYTNNGTFTGNSATINFDSVLEEVLQYVAGSDISGSTSGTSGNYIYDIEAAGNYLYVASVGDPTACSQSAGSAIGCEIQIYDISSSTNLVYVAGRDADGSSSGTSEKSISSLTVSGNYLYVGKTADSTACSQSAGSAIGCELMVFDISSTTNPVYVAGRDSSGSAAGTTSFGGHNTMVVGGDYLYLGRFGDSSSCSQVVGSAIGCEMQIYDISTPTTPTYVAGRDITATAAGAGSAQIFQLAIEGNYLYAALSGESNACTQTAGTGAEGCELQIYDISSSTNPLYKAGRDSNGSAAGSTAISASNLEVSGGYLYLGKDGNSTTCSQTAGSATGCEIMIFNLSSTTNPVYVAGRDASGSALGTGAINTHSMVTNGNYLYLAKGGDATACSQTAGSAIGCELMVFDISSTTNPVYVAGRDFDGGETGVWATDIDSLFVHKNKLYSGKDANSAACSQTTGLAEGCEITSYSISPNHSGGLAFADVVVSGTGATFLNNVNVTSLVIESGVVVAPSNLTSNYLFENNGTFDANSGTVTLDGTSHFINGTTTFYNLTKNATAAATTTFEANSLTTVQNNFTFTGLSPSVRHALRSSVDGQDWYLDPQGTNSISYLDVKDSYNTNVAVINCGTGCLDSTGNTNWTFLAADSITSASDYHFYVGQATTTLGTITLIPSVTAANNLRLSIATTTTNFRFNTSTTNLTFGGTASGKVSGTVSYENSGATLVIDVTTNFAAEDTLTIDGIAVGSFAAISATTSNFTLQTDGNATGTPTATDTKTIRITGSLLLEDASEGQVSSEFSSQDKTDQAIYAFALTANNENATVTDIVFTLSGIQGVDSSNIGDFKLYRDINGDQVIDGGDVLIDGAGILTINGQYGAITFSTDFVASTTGDYMVTADLTNLLVGDFLTIQLMSTGVTALGATSPYSPYKINSITSIQHARNGSGGGGVSSRIGDAPPPGAGEVTGGEEGGGGGAGEAGDGENIAADSDYFRPTATGGQHNEWTNGSNALVSDGTYATAASTNLRQSYTGFSFGIPSSNTIQGIAVKLDTSGTTAAGTIDVAISWDGGSSYTSAKATPTLSGTDVVYSVGGGSDTWGRNWSASEFSTGNFILRVTAQPSANTIRLDALEIRVYHQTGGGGAGGGGGI